ncbi:LysM peptidoglycan-binding domain-containing protein [Senegalia massiliensis]|uniref:LysM peptidoglycan-binding domain-containing protein n=1 Tax=Senegalia massiliensis TaxID=1720316 RepID=A0A845R1R3_9CLOT|nr:LysM peptidoglycan-binding domain-containing protein [Senegalia massiliensis]NBI07929.1 LysM peptidoglycan-binding domain-containing protein [Senegalia massiliensis]
MYNKRLVIVNKFRFVTFLLVLILLFALLLNNLLSVVVASNTDSEYKQIHVKEGDTIWCIAKSNNPEGDDVREVVYKIKKINNISNEWIEAGDILKIPRN